ncbi:MAG: hypothetical protein H7274_18475 [Rhodoferax sp.]|nr:hypothetical protein [Rhodoferax sp.]
MAEHDELAAMQAEKARLVALLKPHRIEWHANIGDSDMLAGNLDVPAISV